MKNNEKSGTFCDKHVLLNQIFHQLVYTLRVHMEVMGFLCSSENYYTDAIYIVTQ